jgi:hypothetical protein
MKYGRLSPVLILLLLGCGNTATHDHRKLDRLLSLNAQARGGAARFEALQALRLEVHLKEPTFEVTGTYAATRDGHVRVDVYAGEQRVFSEALGPSGGWQWHGGKQKTLPLSQEGEAALRRGLVSNLHALYAWPRHGYQLSLALDGKKTHSVVVAAEPEGFTKRLWIDRQSHLVTRVYEFSALHPDVDSTPTEQYSMVLEWMSVSGVQIPRIIEKIDATTGEVIQRSTVLSAQLNFAGGTQPEWNNASYFERPEF